MAPRANKSVSEKATPISVSVSGLYCSPLAPASMLQRMTTLNALGNC